MTHEHEIPAKGRTPEEVLVWLIEHIIEMENIMQEFDQLKADVAALVAAQANFKTRLDAHEAAASSAPAPVDVTTLSTDVKALTAQLDGLLPAQVPSA